MNKPLKKDFGWKPSIAPIGKADEKIYGWAEGDQDAYYEALKAWENRPRKASAGRQRTRQIHPSWMPYLDKFQPVPGRSQGAFCAWAGLNRSTFSAMQTKAVPMHVVDLIGMWAAQGKEVEDE